MANNAQAVYDTMIRALKGIDWKFQELGDHVIRYTYTGKDFPMDFLVMIRDKADMVLFRTVMPCRIPDDKMTEALLATHMANNKFRMGEFVLDFERKQVSFALNPLYEDATPREEWFIYLMQLAHMVADEYNDKFMMLAKGMISLQDII